MEYIRLGKTNLVVSRSAFDSEPLENAVQNGLLSCENAAELLHAAYEGGINLFRIAAPKKPCLSINTLFDTIRSSIRIVSSSAAKSGVDLEKDILHTLACMETDYLDLYRIEDPGFIPRPGGADGLYDTLCALQNSGKILHTGFVTDDFTKLKEVVFSSLYESVEFPFNFLLPENRLMCAQWCSQNDTGFIAAQPLAGGRIENIPLAFGFFRGQENAVPLWPIETKENLEQILYFEKNPPVLDEQFLKDLEEEKKTLNARKLFYG